MGQTQSGSARGKVKWFSQQKGYGFIVAGDKDYYFHVKDVRGAELPRQGEAVTFHPGSSKRGPKASAVTLVDSRAPSREARSIRAQRIDERVVCQSCGKKMVPRIIANRGSASHSVCPFCGATHKRFDTWQWILAAVVFAIIAAVVFGNR